MRHPGVWCIPAFNRLWSLCGALRRLWRGCRWGNGDRLAFGLWRTRYLKPRRGGTTGRRMIVRETRVRHRVRLPRRLGSFRGVWRHRCEPFLQPAPCKSCGMECRRLKRHCVRGRRRLAVAVLPRGLILLVLLTIAPRRPRRRHRCGAGKRPWRGCRGIRGRAKVVGRLVVVPGGVGGVVHGQPGE